MKAHPAADMFPMMGEDELRALAEDIRAHGLHERIVIHEGKILDGRNRFRACQLAEVKPQFTTWKENGQSPTEWVLSRNLHRRHLTQDQRALLAARLREQLSKQFLTARNRKGGLARHGQPNAHVGERLGDSRDVAARMLGVSRRKVQLAIEVLAHPDLLRRVSTGEMNLSVAHRTLEQRHREEIRPKTPGKTQARIECCDFRKFLPTLHNVDLILCDPPYGKEFIPLFGELGRLASECLASNGVLAVMTGQFFVPEYLAAIGKHIPYRWVISYLLPTGRSPLFLARKAAAFWKPIWIFQRGRPTTWIRKDVIEAGELRKDHHEWQQDVDGFKAVIEMVSKPGDLVADVFMGTGTTGVAALSCGRRFAGCDIDPKVIRIARKRLGMQ